MAVSSSASAWGFSSTQATTARSGGMARSGAEALFAAGWDETASYHTVAFTALFDFMNRLVEGLGIKLDPGYIKRGSERLAKRGCLPLIEMPER